MIETNRFIIKKLEIVDVNAKYLGWLNDKELIKYLLLGESERPITLTELKKYVLEKSTNTEIYFYGIFLKNTLEHIGNIKYEIEVHSKKYFMGILIGDKSWHRKGVAVEVVAATKNFDAEIKEIYLAVNNKNTIAIKAFTKCGFKKCDIKNFHTYGNGSIIMRLDT